MPYLYIWLVVDLENYSLHQQICSIIISRNVSFRPSMYSWIRAAITSGFSRALTYPLNLLRVNPLARTKTFWSIHATLRYHQSDSQGTCGNPLRPFLENSSSYSRCHQARHLLIDSSHIYRCEVQPSGHLSDHITLYFRVLMLTPDDWLPYKITGDSPGSIDNHPEA